MLEQMTQEILTLVFVSVATPGVEASKAPEAAAAAVVVVAHPVVATPDPGGGCDYG